MQMAAGGYSLSFDYPKRQFRRKVDATTIEMVSTEPIRIERRCGHRFAQFQVPVLLRAADGRTGGAFTLDLSSHGALLSTDFPLSENQMIEMTLVLPSEVTLTEEMSVRCSARVLRLEFHQERAKPAAAVKIERYEYLPRQMAAPHPVSSHVPNVRP
jgi:hypothetical protein